MKQRDHWRAVYATKSPESVSWYQTMPEPSLVALYQAGAGPGASLIDVGGGASTLIDALLDRGWEDLTVLDIAEPALEAAKGRLGEGAGRVQWLAADITDWRPERTYDAWHDRAVFHFLTDAEQRAGYLRALAAATHPGSLVVMATFALEGPEQCSGLPVRRYDANALAAELGSGFAPVEDWREEHRTPWGASQSFQWAVFRRT